MTTTITAKVTRDNGWWVAFFTLNGIEYGTQARRLDQLDTMIKDAINLVTDKPGSDVEVSLKLDMPEVSELVDDYKAKVRISREAESVASQASRHTVNVLRSLGLTVRDVASLMDISAQRVSQLHS
ncbi:hypothetical protein R6G85_02480 [Actinotignum urinale]|uniref:hypothetical protein n=1 Tax=Actinotignum urinale TaxID=190146 RepID=UPI002A82ED32|nr:hypothetical protein [Actinotignum urinale]MDY5151354.1 hypothetical protein [Actinotignum urinale]